MLSARLLATAATLIFALAASQALAGLEGLDLRGSKTPRGPYAEVTRVRVNDVRDVYVRATNRSGQAVGANLTYQVAPPGPNDYGFRWFSGDVEITQAVRAGGHDFVLPDGSRERFRVRIKAKEVDPGPVCLVPTIEGPDFGGNNARIAINGRTACDP